MKAITKKTAKPEKSELLFAAFFAFVSVAVVLYVRIRLLDMPFERDEGEFAYSGQLILKGMPPYLHAYTMKLPGMAYLDALFFSCFGATVSAVHMGLLISNLISALILYYIGRRLFGTIAAAVSSGLFLLMTSSQHLLGTFAHATHFVILFVLAAFALIISEEDNPSQYRYLSAGFLFGIAFLVKQHAILFLAAAVIMMLFGRRSIRDSVGSGFIMLFGFAIPYVLILMILLKQGTFSTFWFWTVRYASAYATGLTPQMGWLNFKSQVAEIVSSMGGSWLLATAGLLLLLIKPDRRVLSFVLPFLICSFLAICPGFHFRPHYFILVIPVIALLAGSLCGANFPAAVRGFVLATVSAAAIFQLWNEQWFLLKATPQEYLKKAYQTTKPFVETFAVAQYVKNATSGNDRIMVLGSEPQIYFYADRISATGHIYMYPLMEEQPFAEQMQEQMLKQITVESPSYLILVDDLSSWLAVSEKGGTFKEKLNGFVKSGYELDGVASVTRDKEPFYVFGERSRQFVPDTSSRILVYKLKKGARGEV
jgi:Dolichyl-phosphate-mannose-protein mannosyltransferase